MTSLKGQLIVAAPTLVDPNFVQTVVLLLEHGNEGAVGVVLNRPSDVPVEGALPGWEPLVAAPPVLFVGGPVSPDAVIGLARARTDGADDGWEPVLGRLGVLDLSREPDEVRVDRLRVFAGYAGWGAGQLESEIDEGAWFVVEAEPDDGLVGDPDDLWTRVLRRQGGVFRTVTADPTSN